VAKADRSFGVDAKTHRACFVGLCLAPDS
jgi:hypothetical protein